MEMSSHQKKSNNRASKPQKAKAEKKVQREVKKVERVLKAAIKREPKPKKPRMKVHSGLESSHKARSRAAALNIAKMMSEPSKCDPIRLPNTGDLRMGTVPVKERMRWTLPAVTNDVWAAGNAYAGVAISLQYSLPAFQLTSLSNTGTVVWSSVGTPNAYSAMMTNAATMRLNACSVRYIDFQANLYRGGRLFTISYQSEQPAGGSSYVLPASLSEITANPTTFSANEQKIQNGEWVVTKNDYHQLYFGFPSMITGLAGRKMILLFVFPRPQGPNTPPPVNVQVEVTLQYEYVPMPQFQVLTDPRASLVTEATLSEVTDEIAAKTGGDSNQASTPAGLVKRAIALGKQFGALAKDTWDYAQPYFGTMASMLGSLASHERSQFVSSILLYQEQLIKLHQWRPHLFTVSRLSEVWNYFLTGTSDAQGSKFELSKDDAANAWRDVALYTLWHRFPPVVLAHVKHHAQLQAPTWFVDPANLGGMNISNNTLQAVYNPVAELGLANPAGLRPVQSIYAMAHVGGDPPIIQLTIPSGTYSCPLTTDAAAPSLAFAVSISNIQEAKVERSELDTLLSNFEEKVSVTPLVDDYIVPSSPSGEQSHASDRRSSSVPPARGDESRTLQRALDRAVNGKK